MPNPEVTDYNGKMATLRRAQTIIRTVMSSQTDAAARAELTAVNRRLEAIENDVEKLAVIYRTGIVPK